MDKPWMTIQFRSEKLSSEVLTQVILDQLKDLKTNGLKDDDLAVAEILNKQSDDYWEADNQFWLSVLSQYYMLGWDKDRIIKNYNENKVDKAQMSKAVREYFPIDNYTIVTGGN
jgi:predicted Zn-dependent peptidase